MTRRPTAATLTLLMAALATVARPDPAGAASTATYRLVNDGQTPYSVVNFNVIPPGSIAPPVVGHDAKGQPITGSPVTLLGSSSGFDPDKFSVSLASGPGAQGLFLMFGVNLDVGSDGKPTFTPIAAGSDGQPTGQLTPGGQVNFAVQLDPSQQGQPQLVLPPGAAGLHLYAFAPEDSTTKAGSGNGTGTGATTPTPTPSANVPEPATLALWSAVAALGLLRLRARRAA